MLTLTDCLSSRYLLYTGLCDAGVPTGRACLAVDVLMGPEASADDDQADDNGPESWGPETDADVWELGPDTYEPSEDDRRWLNDDGPTDRDIDEAAAYAAMQDHLEWLATIRDEDIITATGSCG
jgi:hypothetical protein